MGPPGKCFLGRRIFIYRVGPGNAKRGVGMCRPPAVPSQIFRVRLIGGTARAKRPLSKTRFGRVEPSKDRGVLAASRGKDLGMVPLSRKARGLRRMGTPSKCLAGGGRLVFQISRDKGARFLSRMGTRRKRIVVRCARGKVTMIAVRSGPTYCGVRLGGRGRGNITLTKTSFALCRSRTYRGRVSQISASKGKVTVFRGLRMGGGCCVGRAGTPANCEVPGASSSTSIMCRVYLRDGPSRNGYLLIIGKGRCEDGSATSDEVDVRNSVGR